MKRNAGVPAGRTAGVSPATKRHPDSAHTLARRDVFERVRKLALSLPDTFEKLSHGEATFFAQNRVFIMFDNNHHHYADRLAVWCNADEGAQEILVGSDPDNFFIPPYVGKSGWVGMRVDRDLPWKTISSVVKDAYAATCRAAASRRSSARRRSRA